MIVFLIFSLFVFVDFICVVVFFEWVLGCEIE